MFFAAVAASILALASAQIGLCPAPNGDFPNPSSERCTTFFRCVQGNPALLRCPANQRFDFLFRICRQQRLVDCNNQLQVFAAPVATTGLGGLGSGVGTFAGNGGLAGLGGLGGLAGGQLGAGLPDGGLLTLLSQLGAGDGDGQNGSNSLASLLVMSALLNKRNAVNQQAPAPGPGPIPFYPANAVLPVGQINVPNWQQPVGNYIPDNAGISQGTGLTLADGKTYVLVPQVQTLQGQLPAGPSQYGGVLSTAPQGQSVYFGQTPLQGQSTAFGGIGQLQLQNMIAQPAEIDADSGAVNTLDSKSKTKNARNDNN